MEQTFLNIRLREKTGKGFCRRLRNDGMVPAVVYGRGFDSVAVTVSAKELLEAIAGEGGQNRLIALQGESSLEGKLVIVSDISRDCLKGNLIHADLHKVNLEEKVKVPVSVSLVGESVGVREGGLLDCVMHSIEIECLANRIPEHIEVDISNLKIGDSFHVSDLSLPAGIKVVEDPSASVVNILGRAREEAVPVSGSTE